MKNAFSLVELSIVLVILGLLTGGILTGQSLIRAAEMRSIVSDIQTIQTSMRTFQGKYFSLPGDIANATDFWGIAGGATGNDDACYTVESNNTQTCNGDGNGRIDRGHSTTTHAERGRFWQHLANAGLIEGSYTGYHGANGAETRIGGTNVKATKISNTHWNIAHAIVSSPSTDNRWFLNPNAHILELTTDFTGTETMREILSPEEAWSIDTKLDDGTPGTGRIIAPKQGFTNGPNCTTTTDAATAEYALTLSSKECFIIAIFR